MDIATYIKTSMDTQASLAKKLGVTQGLISHYLTGRLCVHPEKVIPIFFATDGAVTPFEVRPDIYPDPAWLPQAPESEAAT